MVQWWGRGRGRTETWPPDGAVRRPRVLPWPGVIADVSAAGAERLRNWAGAEAIPGRLLPWLPVAFGFGIALYFTAEREPQWWAGTALTLVCAIAVYLARGRPVAFPIAFALTAVAAGFSIATLKS